MAKSHEPSQDAVFGRVSRRFLAVDWIKSWYDTLRKTDFISYAKSATTLHPYVQYIEMAAIVEHVQVRLLWNQVQTKPMRWENGIPSKASTCSGGALDASSFTESEYTQGQIDSKLSLGAFEDQVG